MHIRWNAHVNFFMLDMFFVIFVFRRADVLIQEDEQLVQLVLFYEDMLSW